MSPTSRTLAWLAEQGYRAGVVERFYGGKRHDLYGFVDILAIDKRETIAVQATGGHSNVSARIAKIRALDSARAWLAGNRRILVVGWKKFKRPVDRKFWRPIIREVTVADLDQVRG